MYGGGVTVYMTVCVWLSLCWYE